MRHNLRMIAAAIAAAALTILVIAVVSTTASATEMPHTLYYLTADADGVQQLFRQTLDGRDRPNQLTRAGTDVLTYGLSERGSEIAYISGGELWLQEIGADDAQSIAVLKHDFYLGAPVFGVNDNYIAYPDDGVWLFDRVTGETTQIVFGTVYDGGEDYRLYAPEKFIADAGGANIRLTMDLSLSGDDTSAAYNLDTGALNEIDGMPGTDLLPLSTGGALIYRNIGVAGLSELFVAPDLDHLDDYTVLVKYEDLTGHQLYADEALELALGHVRVFGSAWFRPEDIVEAFYFDVDVTTGETGEVQFITVSDDLPDSWEIGPLSPDGQMVLYYANEGWFPVLHGEPILIDLMTGDQFEAGLPHTISLATWR